LGKTNLAALVSAVALLGALMLAFAGGPRWPVGVLALIVGGLDVMTSFRRGGDRVLGLMGFLLLMVGIAVLTGRVK
jgi:uncharacterized membrane protein HdeD (DUF308 family)